MGMNTLYNNLKKYNETYAINSNIQIANPITRENQFVLCNALLEGYHCLPKIPTESSGIVTILVDNEKNGFFFDLVIRKVVGFQSCHIYLLNDKSEIDTLLFNIQSTDYIKPSIKLSGHFLRDFIPIQNSLISISLNTFIQYIRDSKILIRIQTNDFPDGLICGTIIPFQFFQYHS